MFAFITETSEKKLNLGVLLTYLFSKHITNDGMDHVGYTDLYITFLL